MAKKDKPQSEAEQAAEQVQVSSMAEALADYDGYVQAQAESLWQYDDLPFNLNMEEQLFVRSYIIDRNDTSALKRLGHMADRVTLKARAKRYLAKAEVQSAIEYLAKRLMEKLSITAERVQAQIAAVAFFDPREIMQFDGISMRLLPSRFWTAEQATAIKKIKMGQYGLEIEAYDRLKAAEMLAKQIGVQPEDNDAAEAARAGADEAVRKIFNIFDKMVPDDPPPELPALPDHTVQ